MRVGCGAVAGTTRGADIAKGRGGGNIRRTLPPIARRYSM